MEELILTSKTTGAKKALPARKPQRAPRATKTRRADAPKEPTLLSRILTSLDDDKAEDIVTIDLEGRSSLADAIVIANGRSQRHVSSIAEHLARRLKEAGYGSRPVDGLQSGDWVLVDAGDIIVHIFRPEVRSYYDLEGMWSVQEPRRAASR
ncbi:MAG: ribosome silencing factor [Rhizomicrobium sp.]